MDAYKRLSFVDVRHVNHFLEAIESQPGKVVLFGMTHYAKWLVVHFGSDKIVCIIDNDPLKQGWTFRNVPIISKSDALKLDFDMIVITSISSTYPIAVEIFQQIEWAEKQVVSYQFFYIEPFNDINHYKEINERMANGPRTMLNLDKRLLLGESLLNCLQMPGDVIEVGAYEGGSTFILCSLMRKFNANKTIYIYDYFNKDTVCLDEVKWHLKEFDFARIIVGEAIENLQRDNDRIYCFAHLDSGVNTCLPVLELVYPRLVQGGIIIFDDYTYLIRPKYHYDRFAREHGEFIMMMPSKGQGMMIKRGRGPEGT